MASHEKARRVYVKYSGQPRGSRHFSEYSSKSASDSRKASVDLPYTRRLQRRMD